jgi:hypothetical protein
LQAVVEIFYKKITFYIKPVVTFILFIFVLHFRLFFPSEDLLLVVDLPCLKYLAQFGLFLSVGLVKRMAEP